MLNGTKMLISMSKRTLRTTSTKTMRKKNIDINRDAINNMKRIDTRDKVTKKTNTDMVMKKTNIDVKTKRIDTEMDVDITNNKNNSNSKTGSSKNMRINKIGTQITTGMRTITTDTTNKESRTLISTCALMNRTSMLLLTLTLIMPIANGMRTLMSQSTLMSAKEQAALLKKSRHSCQELQIPPLLLTMAPLR